MAIDRAKERRRNTTRPPSREPGQSRKRTIIVSLLALGAGAAGVGMLFDSSSETPPENRLFTSVEQCERDSAVPAQECGAQFAAAKQAHENAAPLYPTKQSCEQEYGDGKCANPSSGSRSSYFIPVMAGYMLGRDNRGGYQSAPLYQRRGDPSGQYRQTAAFPRPTPGTTTAARTSGSAFRTRTFQTRAGSSRAYTPSRSVSRGGFGRSSRGFSSS